ncbi:RDD family protein [compost metagenome]
MLDRIISGLAAGIISFIFFVSPSEFFSYESTSEDTLIIYLLTWICQWVYYTIMESSKYQGTLGKKLMRVTVVDRNGNKISFGRANARYWGRILSALLFGVGYFMAIFTKNKQALHDLIASTYVVDSHLLKISLLAQHAEKVPDNQPHSRTHSGFNWPD